jgi:hypothetical protein
MQTPQEPSNRPSFFSVPPNVKLWAHLGVRYWAGLFSGIGLGLFFAKFLQDANMWDHSPGVGFVAICLIGGGTGFALRSARQSLLRESKPASPME